MPEFDIHCNGEHYQTKSFVFPGGEIQVGVPGFPPYFVEGDLEAICRIQSSDDLVRLALLDEILARHHAGGQRVLVIPYFPYARQDRVMEAREAFSLKAMARIINGLDFDRIVICDPHSSVTPALLDNVDEIPQWELAEANDHLKAMIVERTPIVISPDAGALKKAHVFADRFDPRLEVVTASKIRDTKTGKITGTEVHSMFLRGRETLIVDDICDGGRTFIELAKALRAKGATKVSLYVTHGIFSQGLEVFCGLIDAIYTTNSFLSDAVQAADTGAWVPMFVSECYNI